MTYYSASLIDDTQSAYDPSTYFQFKEEKGWDGGDDDGVDEVREAAFFCYILGAARRPFSFVQSHLTALCIANANPLRRA